MDWAKYDALWNCDEVGGRIDADIERYRKADAVVRVTDGSGGVVAGEVVEIEQISSEFLFGANMFMLGGYDTAEMNAKYEEMYLRLFNAGTVALYWKGVEPEPGRLRFAADSERIARRPAVDTAVEFGERHGLNLSGHPLVWDATSWSAPAWLPDDATKAAPMWERRIAQIGERYGKRIKRWDVVNEVEYTPRRFREGYAKRMSEHYEREAFEWAEKAMPREAHLMINDTTWVWSSPAWERYQQIIDGLFEAGAKVDGIGFQFHVFANEEMERVIGGERHLPGNLLKTLDEVLKYDRPVHISEITLPALGNDAEGREAQAKVARNLYRLWFSHRSVHAITWWNLPDGGAAPGESKLASGLLTKEMEAKEGYLALEKLIKDEWRTKTTVRTDEKGEAKFRGFCGGYRVVCRGKEVGFEVKSKRGGSVVLSV